MGFQVPSDYRLTSDGSLTLALLTAIAVQYNTVLLLVLVVRGSDHRGRMTDGSCHDNEGLYLSFGTWLLRSMHR